MQKISRKRIISVLTILTMLLSACFMFASCGEESGGEEQTLKFNIQIYDDHNELICNLTDTEITGVATTIADATRLACETIELDIVVESDNTVSQIGSLLNGVANAASDDAAEPETDENGEEISTEAAAADYYYWEVWVNNSAEPVSANSELKDGDTITWKWVLWVDPDQQ